MTGFGNEFSSEALPDALPKRGVSQLKFNASSKVLGIFHTATFLSNHNTLCHIKTQKVYKVFYISKSLHWNMINKNLTFYASTL